MQPEREIFPEITLRVQIKMISTRRVYRQHSVCSQKTSSEVFSFLYPRNISITKYYAGIIAYKILEIKMKEKQKTKFSIFLYSKQELDKHVY